MRDRIKTILESTLPEIDMKDYKKNPNRQFAAEYSQRLYNNTFDKYNKAIGNYCANNSTLRISAHDRDMMIVTMQTLSSKKKYKFETLHLAGNIADRYLLHCSQNK